MTAPDTHKCKWTYTNPWRRRCIRCSCIQQYRERDESTWDSPTFSWWETIRPGYTIKPITQRVEFRLWGFLLFSRVEVVGYRYWKGNIEVNRDGEPRTWPGELPPRIINLNWRAN